MNLEELLRNQNLTRKELKNNIGKFVFLKDEEIASIFKNEEIKDEYKSFIVEVCFNRINRLPNNIFIQVVQYLENPNIINKYIGKIETLSKDEVFELVLQGYITPEFIVEISKTNSFNRFIDEERKTKKDTRCLNLIHERDLYLDNSINNLRILGKEILETFKIDKNEKEVNIYLDYVISNIKDIDKDDDIIKYCLEILSEQIKSHNLLTESMVGLYSLYRVKELKLEAYIENIYIAFQSNKKTIAYYSKREKCIKLFYKNFAQTYQEVKSVPKREAADILNAKLIQTISHELRHAIDDKRLDQITKIDTEGNTFLRQELYDKLMRVENDDQIYKNNHDHFLCENRADIFSYIDFAIQTNKIFKDAFDKERLEIISSNNAASIIEMYVEITEKGMKVISPAKKFHNFFIKQMKAEEVMQKYAGKKEAETILANLMDGENIPLEVVEETYNIALGTRKTTNLYQEILNIIAEYQNKLKEEKELSKVI